MRDIAMRERNTGRSARPVAAVMPANHFPWDATCLQRCYLFTAAAEHERIAALQAHDALALPGRATSRSLIRLRKGSPILALPDEDPLRGRRRVRERRHVDRPS